MILVDLNHVVIPDVCSLAAKKQQVTVDLVRHVALNSIRTIRNRFYKEFGELVICCDAKSATYWRKKEFPYYKANRSSSALAGVDKKLLMDSIRTIATELDEFFPYRTVLVDGAEADDIIAVLVKWSQTTDEGREFFKEQSGDNLLSLALESGPKTVIISSDRDFKQLHKYSQVSQWTNRDKKFMKSEDVQKELLEKLVRGDAGDGIPNIKSPDDVFVRGDIRQKQIKEVFLDRLYAAETLDDVPLLLEDETQRRNYARNRTLIDFAYIPKQIESNIIDAVKAAKVAPRYGLMAYFAQNNLVNLTPHIKEF